METMSEREELIYMFSDTFKDAYGFRPRWDWFSLSLSELKVWYKTFRAEIEENEKGEARAAEEAIVFFKNLLQETIGHGANSIRQAKLWLLGDERDIEYWVWGYGILFTDYGRELVKEMTEIRRFNR